MSNLHEECGVFGIYCPTRRAVASTTYYALFALQHRGQQSCGIAVNDGGQFHAYKDSGLVSEVMTPRVMEALGEGTMAIGHVRYGADSDEQRLNAQPLVVNHVKGRMALAYNGTFTNYFALREQLEMEGAIFHTTGNTEVFSYILTRNRLQCGSLEEAVNKSMDEVHGAYSMVIMSRRKLIALRDPCGFRPLCYGKTEDGSYVVASESCALDAVGATLIRDVRPGEILVFDENGVHSREEHCGKAKHSLCVFEYVYFARPDSVIDGCSVHEARLRAGAFLALENPVRADIVIGVPDSGIDAAIGYSRQSGIPYGLGFIKNRYIARTFIAPGQSSRENLVRIKLNPIASVVRGKRVVLVDDSIVRGTTCKRIVKLLRDAGATEIHMAVTAPPFIHTCYYGTDSTEEENLIACRCTQDEIRQSIGVDSLTFLSCEHVQLIAKTPGSCGGYCDACFTGRYPIEVPDRGCREHYENQIGSEED